MPTKPAESKLLKSSQRSNKNAEGKFGLAGQFPLLCLDLGLDIGQLGPDG